MNLKEYLDKHRLTVPEFAAANAISISSIYHYLAGGRPTKRIAYLIEKYTRGEVTLEELRGKK